MPAILKVLLRVNFFGHSRLLKASYTAPVHYVVAVEVNLTLVKNLALVIQDSLRSLEARVNRHASELQLSFFNLLLTDPWRVIVLKLTFCSES